VSDEESMVPSDTPATAGEQIVYARDRMDRMRNDPMALSYWTGYLDGVQTMFELMRPKDGQ
jgi:hypothetical protein